jgi:hypothetical protein
MDWMSVKTQRGDSCEKLMMELVTETEKVLFAATLVLSCQSAGLS